MEGRPEHPVLMALNLEQALRRRFAVALALALVATQFVPAVAVAAEDGKDAGDDAPAILEEVLIPVELERRTVSLDKLDTENFEIGAWGGGISFQDFGVDAVYGAAVSYHLTEDLFFTGRYAQSRLGRTSFETLSGGFPLLSDEDRNVALWDLSVGWNILPGEVFVGSRWAMAGALYLEAGAGSTEFAGDANFTVTLGAGYRLLANDWISMHIGIRDYVFNSDLLGVEKTTHNIAVTGGLSIFF